MSDDVIGCESSVARESQQDLRVRLNQTGRDYPRDACVHQLIEKQARRTPDRVAASFNNENLTYAELERRANQLANYLLRIGVGPDVLVGISLPRSLDMLVALLGILKAGGAYVPLDPSYPKDRLAFMLNDAQLRYVVTEEHLRQLLRLHAGVTICLDSESESIAAEATVIKNNRTRSHNLSYVLYTSGSTGKPKGVQIEHRSAVNLLMSMRERPALSEDDVLVAVTTLSFDIAGLELYLPLMVGARVVIVSHEVACDGERLLNTLKGCGATVMQATPVTWRLLIEAGWSSRRMKVLVGGEALPRELARQLTKRGNSVWNLYGPTETTIWSSVYRVGDEVTATVPIGQPIANTQMYILDSNTQLVQVGDTGQLYIGGDGLARGYLNRPDLNAGKFVPNPFRAGTKLYATGDLARYLPSGDIEFLGRMDHQVKIRGFRVELGEVESALEERPGVRQAIVMARDDPSGAKRLVAYIVAQGGDHPSSSALRNALRSKLPAYMIPALYVPLDKMPLTANGKVDRGALPEPPVSSLEDPITAVPPANPLETQITHVWEKVLGHKPVGIHDNFFDLGGDSFLAVKVVQRIEKICGQRLPIAAFFRAPTVAEMAVLLRTKDSVVWPSLVQITEGGSKPPFFCVHGLGGGVLRYRDLARHLPPDQPVYGLQALGLDGRCACLECLEDMAAHYIEEIRVVQPEGPYYLGGFSFGGVVAFEMARQLHQLGQDVGLVALLDSFPTNYARRSSLARFWHLSGQQKMSYVLNKVKYLANRMVRRISNHFLPPTVKQVQKACLVAAQRYVPKVYPGRVILFRASERTLGSSDDLFLGWNDLALGGAEVHEIQGNHLSIVDEPAVHKLAAELALCLDRAAAAHKASVFAAEDMSITRVHC